MDPQFTASPLRTYAADAIAAHRQTPLQAVLRDRIAARLAVILRTYTGRPIVALEALTPRERLWCETEAAVLVGIAEAIREDAPPTPGEVRRVEARREVQAVQRRLRCEATRLGHVLGGYRPAFGAAGYEDVACERCGAGARLHTLTAAISVSEALREPCGR